MDHKMERLDNRNRLMTKLLWFAYLLGLGSNFAAGVPVRGIVAFAVVGLFAVGSLTVLTYGFKKAVPYIKVDPMSRTL